MKRMYKTLLVVTVLALTVLSLCSCGENWDDANYITYTCPAPLRLVTTQTIQDGLVTDVLEAVELTEQDALNALKDGRVLFTSFLPNEDPSAENKFPSEIFMTVDTSQYIRNVFNFNALTEEQRTELFDQLTEPATDDTAYKIDKTGVEEKNGIHWICYRYSHTDNVGTQYVAQYTTMYNGFSYTLSAVSAEELDERTLTAMDTLLESVGFSETLEPMYEYVPRMTFWDSFSRSVKENWISLTVVAVVTVGATAGIMVYSNYRKKHPVVGTRRKNDGVVRGDYLK